MIEWVILAGLYAASKAKGSPTAVDGKDLFNSFDNFFKKYATQYGLDWKLMKAISMNEAGLGVAKGGIEPSVLQGLLNPNDVDGSKSSDGKSWGLMQMTIPTAKDFDPSATPQKLNDPEYSIRISAQFIAWVTLRFKESDPRFLEWIVKSYNQGAGYTLKEKGGAASRAQAYWDRFQRNYARLARGE